MLSCTGKYATKFDHAAGCGAVAPLFDAPDLISMYHRQNFAKVLVRTYRV